jgi:hypothetical protein
MHTTEMPAQLEYSEYSLDPSKQTSMWTKIKGAFRRVFCCCCRPTEVEIPIYDHSEDLSKKPPAMYKTPGGMVMWDPNSGTPCPHLLTTTNPRTGESSCCHCKEPVKSKPSSDGIHAMFN